MNIEDMAQDYILNEVSRVGICSIDSEKIVEAFNIAEAMQAEFNKRKPQGLPEAIQDDFQVDWDQAPSWAEYWTSDDLAYYWWSLEPKFISEAWHFAGGRADICGAPSFNYKGDWKNSLRQRPR